MCSYVEKCLSRMSAFELLEKFKGRGSLQSSERKGSPSAFRAEESLKPVRKCLAEDQL